MMLTRRRFLSLCAAASACPANAATPITWRGVALGAEVQVDIHAPARQAAVALQRTRQIIDAVEQRFSLFDPGSDLAQLNRHHQLPNPHPWFLQIIDLASAVHRATSGQFDPTIQPWWSALSRGQDPASARAQIGWHKIHAHRHRIAIEPGQAITLNGIAQGFATDLVRTMYAALGLRRCLINLGEFAALGGPFVLGVQDPQAGLVTTQQLDNDAIATSSPGAMTLADGATHILGPTGRRPIWSTVSVRASSAAVADAASTAFCLMNSQEITRACRVLPAIKEVIVISDTGDLHRITA